MGQIFAHLDPNAPQSLDREGEIFEFAHAFGALDTAHIEPDAVLFLTPGVFLAKLGLV
ncbi:MAG: hypothetical protein HC883_03505 [Bdellovibrionaceae bacterium]|nr:hypothetical protein [Pseudobdellovibrionaceae bacterium]